MLDEYWKTHPDLHAIPIYQASGLARKALTVYQTYLEMMNEDIKAVWQVRRWRGEGVRWEGGRGEGGLMKGGAGKSGGICGRGVGGGEGGREEGREGEGREGEGGEGKGGGESRLKPECLRLRFFSC